MDDKIHSNPPKGSLSDAKHGDRCDIPRTSWQQGRNSERFNAKRMRRIPTITVAIAIIGCVICYCAGFNSGKKLSALKEEREGAINSALHAYWAAEATNWAKVHTFVDFTLLSATRDYEKLFGIPNGTNLFAGRFAEAKKAADQIERSLVPLESAFGSNVDVRIVK